MASSNYLMVYRGSLTDGVSVYWTETGAGNPGAWSWMSELVCDRDGLESEMRSSGTIESC